MEDIKVKVTHLFLSQITTVGLVAVNTINTYATYLQSLKLVL